MAKNSKLDELKEHVVEILQDCDGYRLDLSKFKKEYSRLFGEAFNHRLYGLKNKKLASIMQEIGDVVSLEPGALSKSVDIILKEAFIPLQNHTSSPVQDTIAKSLPEIIPDFGCSVAGAEDEKPPEENERTAIPLLACENPSLEFSNSPCSPPVIQRAAGHLPGQVPTPLRKDEQCCALVGGGTAMIPTPFLGILGPAPLSPITLPSLSPLPLLQQNVSPGLSYESQGGTPLQAAKAGKISSISPLSFQEIMKQQLEEEEEKKSTVASPVGSNNARVRKVGEPGPFEDSFTKAQEIQASSNRREPKRNITLGEVDRTAQNIISCLSEEGSYVSLEVVKAKLCEEFGKSSIKALGFRRDVDIPALQELIKLQARVSLFVHAYVMSSSIATLYELSQSIADMESKSEFQDLELGPLVKQPVVYDLFKAPQDLASIPHVTTTQILKHLENYMKKEDLWRKKVNFEKFLQYLCEEYQCETPYYLGVRIKSMGLPISVIKQANRSESQRWKTARETVSKEMDGEIVARLRKIKRDLLGQEAGDLRSRIMKLVDASPVDILNEVFNCCLEFFEGHRQKRTSEFFAMVTSDSLGRQLFQLALHTACRRLVGPIPEETCAAAGLVKPVDKNNMQEGRKKEPTPPSAGALVDEVKAWLAKADTLDLARLARIETNVVSKFPNFTGFEQFGYGSFLHFLTNHKKLGQALEEVGGMVGAGREGACRGMRVSPNSVLDFILQCGTQTSPEVIEKTLCTYYGVNKVTDLGLGSFSRLREKADERRKSTSGVKGDSIVYEAALLCNDAVKRNDGTSGVESHNGAVLGWKGKEEAISAMQSTPLLEDVALWTQWDDVFGGEVSGLGKLPSFLENERILMSVRKSSSRKGSDIVVMETSPGILLRVTTDTSPEYFHECVSRYDALGAAGHLVSMVIVNGGVSNTPTALLANHVHSSLAALASSATSAEFVLDCLIRMPRRLAASVGAKVFLEPLKELAGSTEAPGLLISSCKTQSQRSCLHQLGFALGVNLWIEDFQRRVSSRVEDQRNMGAHQNKKQNRPIGLVKPVTAHIEHFDRKQHFEESGSVGDFSSVANIVDGISSVSTDKPPKPATVPTPDVKQHEECKALIEQIRREDFGIGFELAEGISKVVNKQREREGRGLHRLSTELYSRDTHFVLELVQNADDNSYPEECNPSLVFILQSDKIVVLNNERGFEERNIRALCDVGRSTKGAHRYGYIGQKGIGFKSVFRVSDSPEVHSNGYHIRFDAKSGPMGYILPQWIGERLTTEEEDEPRATESKETKQENERGEGAEDAQAVLMVDEYEGWATRIVLPLKEEHQGAATYSLTARFRDVHPSLLLFLHRLRRIVIQDKTSNTCSEMVRRDLGESVMEVSHTNGTDRWLVIKKELDSSKMKEDVEVSELALAFPLLHDTDLDTHDAVRRRHQAWPQQNVFAYLPLRSYGFRFIIQGDFEVPSSREDVDSDKPWNQWLREAIPQLFIDSLDVFRNHSSFLGFSSVVAYFQFVPLEEEISDFFTPVARHILKLLQGTQCIPVVETLKANDQTCSRTGEISSSNCKWVLPCKAIDCHDSATRELISPPMLEEHLGLFFLHPAMAAALNPILRSRLGIDTLSSKHLIEIGKAEVKKASTNASARISWVARWLQCVYRCLEEERNSSQDVLNVIASLSVVPLTDGSFVNLTGDSLFFPLSLKKESGKPVAKRKAASGKKTSDQSNSTVLEGDLSTVHPSLFLSLDDIGRSQVEELLRRLGVKSWTPKELINSHILPNLKSDKWKGKSNEVLRSYLLYIHEQRLSDPTVCDVDDLRSCVQILTNKGSCNPSKTPVHFTPKYGNKIDLARQLPSISWTLVDDSYLSLTGCVQELTELLAELGVKRFLAINRKQVKLERTTMGQTPWASYVNIWPTTPDGLYLVEDWACDEFEEFIGKLLDSENSKRVSPKESRVLAECIDELWDSEYAKCADGFVRYKDTNGHILGETRSSFYLNLVSKPWMSTNQEGSVTSAATFSNASPFFFKPNELFMKTDSVYELLEDHVQYVAADLKNPAFCSTLGIRESVDVETLLGEMTQWSCAAVTGSEGNQKNVFTTSVGHMSKVYSFLLEKLHLSAADKERIQDAFHTNGLIFIPDCSSKPPGNRQFRGRFYKKKEVCWRDPTDLSAKLFNEHGRKRTRHLLQEHYSKNQRSLSAFFIDALNVDETPNMDEYIEMASFVSEVAGFPTPSSMDDMFKIFSILGRKCVACGQNDSIRVEVEIDQKMSSYLKQRLEKEERLIFPSLDKWVALSAKPLVPDDKSLQKIFQKETEVHFLDLDSFFRSSKSQLPVRKAHDEGREMQKNVSLFLRCCMIDKLSECVEKQFTPDMVQYQCVPLQKYFHRMAPSVQRFLYYKMQELYSDLKKKGFAQKLSNMKFATVKGLETVYSLRTHPGVVIPVAEKSGVETVSSSYCFYVVQQHQNDLEVINAEMAKLFLVGQKTSSEFRNFLLAVGNYHGDNLEHFLEEQQGLEPLPEGEELWFVPPPEEPEVVEVEETPSTVFPNLSNAARTHSTDDNELHSWPPKSSPQFDKVRRSQETSSSISTLKMWPPPAPPASAKVDTHREQIQENSRQQGISTAKRPTETERMMNTQCEQVAPEVEAAGITVDDQIKKTEINPIKWLMESETCNVSVVARNQGSQQVRTCDVQPNVSPSQLPGHEDGRVCPTISSVQDRPANCLISPTDDVKYPSPSFRFLEDTTAFDVPYEELPLNSDLDILKQMDFGESPNKEEVGRWGEQFVFNFLQAKYLPHDDEVEIRWMNEIQNTTAPYDFQILRGKTVEAFVEVKSTCSAQKEAFEISVQELSFALEKREAFHLYRVFNAGKPSRDVRLLRFKNIAAHLEKKNLKLCMVI